MQVHESVHLTACWLMMSSSVAPSLEAHQGCPCPIHTDAGVSTVCKNPSPHPLDTHTKAGKENAQPESTKEQILGAGVMDLQVADGKRCPWAGH